MINKLYTYKDYLTWPDEVRCKLIDGVIYDMTPAPLANHQEISMELFGKLWLFLKNKKSKVYHAPFDVRFPDGDEDEGDIKTVVQPDIAVICDKKKLPVHPEEKTVMVFSPGKDKLYGRPKNYSANDKIKVGVLKGLTIDLNDVSAGK